jgi:hypothetical protein
MHIIAYLSMAKASRLPELKHTDQAVLDMVIKNAIQCNTAEDYVNRLTNAPRRNPELKPVAEALAGQFIKDNSQAALNLSGYDLIKEYGATKQYQVTERNSKVVFDVTFYFYGGILSGWSVEPEKVSYDNYKNGSGA